MNSGQWRLGTFTSDYIISLLDDGSGLVLDYWGASLGEAWAELAPTWSEPIRFVSHATMLDSAPLEYASAGQRHVAFSELLVDHGDSLTGASWRVERDAVFFEDDDTAARLSVPFTDESGRLRLTLHTSTSSHHDIVHRSMSLVNLSGDRTVELPRAFSAGWNVPVGQNAHIDYLAGTWSNEFNKRQVDLDWGTFSMGSREGITGLRFSPVMTLTARSGPGSFERPAGDAYGVALAWSGSWSMHAENGPVGQNTRVSCGVDDDTTTITLLPGESFDAPPSLGVFSARGTEGVSRAWHDYQRHSLARGLSALHHPVVYNSWMATTFDVRVDHQIKLANIAADVGVEVFVVDDGWFVGRTTDEAGLGDWVPDPRKFPDGLGALADRVRERGMRFGLWIEPECVNANSDLFRAHPDWVYRADDRPLITIRNQYVLDLGRTEVVEWIENTFRRLLESAPISYIKWDMNRPVTDGGRPGDPHGRQWSVQHTLGYYRVLGMLRAEYPDLTIEACASGGARIDNAVLALSDVVWPSDEVGARDRLVIQHGFLSAYPPSAMSSWVSDDRGHRDRSDASLGFRFAVSMAGVLGIGSDLLGWGELERSRAAQLVAFYKEIRPVVLRGTVATHGEPVDNLYCVEYCAPEDDGRIVLFVYDRDRDKNRDREQPRVFPTLLRAGVTYRVKQGAGLGLGGDDAAEAAAARTVADLLVTTASARALGVVVGFGLAIDADVIVLEPVA